MTTQFDPWDSCIPDLDEPDLSKAAGNNGVTGVGTVGDDQVDLRNPGSPDNYRGREGDDRNRAKEFLTIFSQPIHTWLPTFSNSVNMHIFTS